MTAPLISTVFDPPLPADPKATFNLKAFALVAALNGWSTQANAVSEYLDGISFAVGIAQIMANYKGEWSTLTGPLSQPARVSHGGAVYELDTASVADVTAHVPGVSSVWFLVPTTSAQITHGASTVADALTRPTDKNLVINGRFEINQREKSGTVTLTAGQYGHDGWKGGSAGCQYTFSTVGGVTEVTIISGSLINTVEGVFVRDGTYVLSWSGTAEGKIGPNPYGPSGSTRNCVNGVNMPIEFRNGTLTLVQFEKGNTPTGFDYRLDELRRCQRLCWKTYSQGVAPGTVTLAGCRGTPNVANIAYGAVLNLDFPVEMAAAPTVTFYNPSTGAAGTWRSGAADYAMGNASIPASTNSALVGNSAAIAPIGQTLFGHALVEVLL